MTSTIEAEQSDTVILICTTPLSKRIREKCFAYINGIKSLEHILNRIKNLKLPTVLLIPEFINDTHLSLYKNIYSKYGVEIFKGNTLSPLHRMAEYLKDKNYKYVMRITHDDILIDDISAYEMLKGVKINNSDYGYCPSIIEGAGVEIIKADIIRKKAEEIKYPVEHLSYFVKGVKQYQYVPRETIKRQYRLTMDYPEDVIILEAVLRYTGNESSIDKICKFIDGNPLLLKYNELPEITVYTCMRNAGKWIVDCISSVIMASRVSKLNIEYIIIDDKSEDDTLIKALTQVGMWDYPKCKIIVNNENKGLASSSNIALENAKGKYILRIDADDILEPTALKYMVEKIKKEDAAIVYPNYYEDYGDDNFNIGYGWKHHHAGGALMDKKIINELKFKEGLKHWDSLELYQRIKAHKELKISYLQEPMFRYRKHQDSLSANNTGERKLTYDELMRSFDNEHK
jgi:spore coat polysaccharide biosynthesis protein SpsF (cytidylyltransferase family)